MKGSNQMIGSDALLDSTLKAEVCNDRSLFNQSQSSIMSKVNDDTTKADVASVAQTSEPPMQHL
jgi:hypothetical protein